MLQGQSCEAMAQIFILPGPLLFLILCQHFHKFTLQAQVTRLEGNSGVLVVAYNAREQLADKGQS